jgi:hypothetical protein
MATDWKKLKADLEKQTLDLATTCPDEIKRFHYGIITHSDAGKDSLNQYFGHWVHSYAGYYSYVNEIGICMQMAADPRIDLQSAKIFFKAMMHVAPFFAEYAGQKTFAAAAKAVIETVEGMDSKQDMVQLLSAFQQFESRLYWWFHWYFPWGIGPVLCPRRSQEDIQEMVRLSQPAR